MKLFAGLAVSATLVVVASAANAQMLAPFEASRSPYRPVSDFEAPYAGAPAPRQRDDGRGDYGRDYGSGAYAPGYYGQGYGQGYGQAYGGPALLPPLEVYAVLRENGFSPLGIPRLRGSVYLIAALDRGGEDGRLVIDARTGRILRFMPAFRFGAIDDEPAGYGAQAALPPRGPLPAQAALAPQAALPPPTAIRGVPRPPASIPHVASRAVPVPSPKPQAATPESSQPSSLQQSASQPSPAQQSASAQPASQTQAQVQARAADPQPAAAPATVGQAKPAPVIQPTQAMPAVQGLE
jgi:hypothetical protein